MSLADIRSCNWEEGLREAGEQGIFIAPPVSGWTLAIGATLPDASDENTLPLIVRLSETHGSVQYFGNHRVLDYYAWAKAERGRLHRAYAYLGEQGSVLWDRGELTKEELDLGLIFDPTTKTEATSDDSIMKMLERLKNNLQKYPTEEDVFAIGRKWSIDPTQIEDYEITDDLGILGYFPR